MESSNRSNVSEGLKQSIFKQFIISEWAVGVEADTRSAYFYQSCNNPRKCLDFRMFLRSAGLSELRKVHGNFLRPSCLFQQLFYRCSILCSEGELAMLILPGGVSAYRWEVRSWVREEGGRERE